MNQKRNKPGVGVVDDKIFVFGGFDGEQYLKTIEVYSEKTKRWEMMKVTMKTGRSYMGVAVIGDLIFIIGGWNERGFVEKVEVMNTKTQTMETFTRIPTGRSGMGVGVVDDRFIWTFGGFYGDDKVVDVIEMCDIKTGEWKTLNVKMTFPRVDSRAVVVNDKIWIIGGKSSTTSEPVKEVEVIDTKTMTWTIAPSMIIPHKYHTAIGF